MYFFLTVITSAIVSSILGALWYSKWGFQKQWMKASQISTETQENSSAGDMRKAFGMNFILECFIAWALTYFVLRTSTETVFGSIEIGLRMWFFIVVPVLLSSYIWEKKSFALVSLLAGHRLITLVGASITIALFY